MSENLAQRAVRPRIMGAAIALQRLAIPFGITGAILAGRSALMVTREEPEPVAEQWALAGIALLAASALAWALSAAARRTYQRAGRTWYENARHVHLYLRPFTTDQTTAPQLGGSAPPHLEEELAAVLAASGVPVAISNPGEKGADFPLGFVRLDVPSHYHPKPDLAPWQQYVIEMLDRAEIVTAIAGPSSSMRWEITTALQRCDRSRLAFFVGPDATEEDVAGLRSAFADAGVGLPADMGGVMAVTFDERGIPVLRLADREVWSPKMLRHRMRAAVKDVLGPAHRSIGVDLEPPNSRVENARALARYAGFTLLVGAFGLVSFLMATLLYVPVDLVF